MSIFTLPASITVTNPANSGWNTLTKMNNSSYDTTTEEHYASGSILTSPKFKFVNTNGVVSFHVNNFSGSNASGGNPSLVSKIGLNGSDEGDSVTVSHGDTVYFYNIGATSLHGQFTIPSSGWWSVASGGGTSTEGVSVNSIYLDVNGAPWVRGTIASSEPTGSYPVTTGGVLVQGSLVTNPISHTNGTETVFSFPIAYGGGGIWHLHQHYVSSALNTPIATVTVPSLGKKVFCNFW